MPVDPGAVINGARWLATTYAGDGDITINSQSATNLKWDCEKNDQVAQVCPFIDVSRRIGTFRLRTYAFFSGLGYISQSFEVRVAAETNGCDVVGAYVYVTGYKESTIGRTANWRINAIAADTRKRGVSGCDDCCPYAVAVKFSVNVSTPGFNRSYRVRVFGNGSITVRRQ